MEKLLSNKQDTVKGELLLFRTLWNNSSDNMFIVRLDKDGELISEASNHALEKTFGFLPHQLDEVKLKDILDEKTYRSIYERYHKCASLNEPITYEESANVNDNGLRYWNTTILPVVDEDQTIRIFGISREITELKNISKKLKEVNESLESQVQERTKELARSLDEIKRISIHDSMTQLYNRMKLEESLEHEIKQSSKFNNDFGVILLDIDFFKNINDTYGHLVGDAVLKEFANLLRSTIRATDIVGRWGGEEFLIICTHTNIDNIYAIAQKMRKKIQDHKFSKIADVTASFGVTVYNESDSVESIIKRVDDALYEAKNSSRNCVVKKSVSI